MDVNWLLDPMSEATRAHFDDRVVAICGKPRGAGLARGVLDVDRHFNRRLDLGRCVQVTARCVDRRLRLRLVDVDRTRLRQNVRQLGFDSGDGFPVDHRGQWEFDLAYARAGTRVNVERLLQAGRRWRHADRHDRFVPLGPQDRLPLLTRVVLGVEGDFYRITPAQKAEAVDDELIACTGVERLAADDSSGRIHRQREDCRPKVLRPAARVRVEHVEVADVGATVGLDRRAVEVVRSAYLPTALTNQQQGRDGRHGQKYGYQYRDA
jgi:hypothetical protein